MVRYTSSDPVGRAVSGIATTGDGCLLAAATINDQQGFRSIASIELFPSHLRLFSMGGAHDAGTSCVCPPGG